MRRYLYILIAILASTAQISAQSTIGIYGGAGSGGERFYPEVESRSVYGLANVGFSWRTYGEQKYVGCFGIDVEYLQRGFSFAPYASSLPEGEPLRYYTRTVNSITVPIVWQPHVYMFHRRARLFADAAATFSYDFSSTYVNEYDKHIYEEAGLDYQWEGDYEYVTARDNRFGYGLAFGGGLALLIGKRFEVMGRVRYYLGLSDVVRNRNKYYSNNIDGAENPFSLTPIRSSLTNMMITVGVNYNLKGKGFNTWYKKAEPKSNIGREFNYKGD